MFDLISKKALLLLFVSTTYSLAFAQTNSFEEVDAFAADFKEDFVDVPTLAKQLTEPFETDLEKSRAIFMWIAHNLRYDTRKFHNPKRHHIEARSPQELEAKKAAYREKQIAKAAKYKKGVCEDYSLLFKALCDEAGLEAAYITGNARDFYKPYRSAHNNPHAWNAIKIDGQWYLLDATWAAGHTNPEVTKFTRKISPGFFMTPPAWFAQYHFPDEPKWQLLDQPLDKKSFPNQPMVNFGQNDYPVLDFSKQVADTGGKGFDREFRIKLGNQPKYFMLATRKGKPIKHSRQTEGGYEVFRFSSRGVRDLVVYCGKSQKRMGWLAKYDL